MKPSYLFTVVSWLVVSLCAPIAAATETIEELTETGRITATVLATDFYHPWALAFLPDGDMLLTQRSGELLRLDHNGAHRQVVHGLPEIREYGQGGLLDVAVHPEFNTNRFIYFSYAGNDKQGIGTEVARAKLKGNSLSHLEVLFKLQPKSRTKHHFGSRLVFDNEGHLYITLGDRGDRPRAQQLNDHAGSVIRLNQDGSIPSDNPYKTTDGALPEIYSYGHRNAQGAALHPDTGELWLHEHGPQGGDELNISRAGDNYGWPIITYGANYGSGSKIGKGTEQPGMTQPLYYWVPSIAPSGMAFYTGDQFKDWQGDLLVGSLKFQLLARLVLDGEKVRHEERLFAGKLGRIRDVRQGPDGLVYLLTDSNDGKLVRLQPSN